MPTLMTKQRLGGYHWLIIAETQHLWISRARTLIPSTISWLQCLLYPGRYHWLLSKL